MTDGTQALWWISGFVPFVLAALSGGVTGQWLRHHGMVDQPDQARRLHADVTPRGGGVLIAAGLWSALIIQWGVFGAGGFVWPLVVFVLAATGMGWLEDLEPRPIRFRLLAQFGLALGVWLWLGAIETVGLGQWHWGSPWLWSILGVVAIVWLMNLHNFMDGADGLATAQGIWSGACYAWLFGTAGYLSWALLAVALAGGCAGFLIWNRPVAKLFMGDSGSLLLGGLVGLFAYHAVSSGAASLMVCLMISAVFVVDATATLLWRIGCGQRWYTAHACHAFQRLIAGGLSHAQVLVVYVALNIGLVLPALTGAVFWPGHEAWLGMGLFSALIFGWWRVQRRTEKLGPEG
ncbi:MAG TPA: hypothetical protein VIC53_03945 [Wenzhouxiangella sp.]